MNSVLPKVLPDLPLKLDAKTDLASDSDPEASDAEIDSASDSNSEVSLSRYFRGYRIHAR